MKDFGYGLLTSCRRGCFGQSEYRERGRERACDWFRTYKKSLAGSSFESWVTEGLEQGWGVHVMVMNGDWGSFEDGMGDLTPTYQCSSEHPSITYHAHASGDMRALGVHG